MSPDRRQMMFMIYGKDNKVVLPLQEDRWYRVELLQEPSKKNGKVNIFFWSRSGSISRTSIANNPVVILLIPNP